MNSKIIASVVGVVALVGAGSYYYMNMNQVQANNDYICTLHLKAPICDYNINNCTWSGGLGTCTGNELSSVTYSSERVNCDGTKHSENGGDYSNEATIYNKYKDNISGAVDEKLKSNSYMGSESYQTSEKLITSGGVCVVENVPAPTGAEAINPNTNSGIENSTTGTGYIDSENTEETSSGSSVGSGTLTESGL